MLIEPTPAFDSEVRHSGDRIVGSGAGSLVCEGCGFAVSLAGTDWLPECPNCGGGSFRRTSLFERPTISAEAIDAPAGAPAWLEGARAQLDAPGSYLAFERAEDEPTSFRLGEGWTRIGRSARADLRLDDSTVSRRHALVVLTPDGDLRALDDRSLNGLFVNGERVEWTALDDGDELEIGRYRLYVLRA